MPHPLARDEEEAAQIALENGDQQARDTLIEHNLRLVVYNAKRYETNPIFMEDLISIGTIGLIKAVNTFKRDKNIKLVTYASRCIENEILMFLRKKSRRKTEISFDEPLTSITTATSCCCPTFWEQKATSSRKASMPRKTSASC